MRKLKYGVRSIALAGGLTVTLWANANDPTSINITGLVVASPCQIRDDSVEKVVDFGQDIKSTSLSRAGTTTDWLPFDIGLIACPSGTTTATVTFTGDPDGTHPEDMYKNSGDAKNVAIQMQKSSGEAMGNGKTYAVDISNKSAIYNLRARIYSYGEASSGSVSALVTATFTYQ